VMALKNAIAAVAVGACAIEKHFTMSQAKKFGI
ncbi:MAG TPA: hypothetical protein EYN38_00615, partial [Flavobacteriales bacterium]|nr:hypothetical protein [Flavobacteriales bacterium]